MFGALHDNRVAWLSEMGRFDEDIMQMDKIVLMTVATLLLGGCQSYYAFAHDQRGGCYASTIVYALTPACRAAPYVAPIAPIVTK
jgi:hypothetical protein